MKNLKSLLVFVLIIGLFVLTGCEKGGNGKKDNTVDITYTLGKGVITLSVPKNDEGKAKYEFTETKPEGATVSKTVYLVTDNSILGFATSGLVYNTSQKYKAKYGDKEASFENYLEFIEDTDLFNKKINLPGLEQLEINGRKALRYYSRVGSSGNYKYNGYFYLMGVDDIYKGSELNMLVVYKDAEKPTEAKEFDQETLDIINSLKITAANN